MRRTERKNPLTSPSLPHPLGTLGAGKPHLFRPGGPHLGEQRGRGLSLHQALAMQSPCQLYFRDRFIFWSKKKKKE